MAKARRPAADFAVYLAVRLAVCVVQAMPSAWAFAVAELLGRLAYRVDKRHRRVAEENLRAAFPELAADPAAVDRLVRGCFRHFAAVAVEMVLLPRKMTMATWRRYGSLPDGAALAGGLLADRPTLMVTGHFGNWEFTGYTLGANGHRTYAIARVLDNPYLERFLKRFRQATGQTIVAKKNDFDRLSAVLRAGGKVGVLADQDAGPRGVFVDFFGRPASAHKAVALMAIEFDAVVVVAGTVRVSRPPGRAPGPDGLLGGVLRPGEFYYEGVTLDVIDPREYVGRTDAVKAITQRYHAALEHLIRRHPEQYFWLHRRWKTQPAARKKPADGPRAGAKQAA